MLRQRVDRQRYHTQWLHPGGRCHLLAVPCQGVISLACSATIPCSPHPYHKNRRGAASTISSCTVSIPHTRILHSFTGSRSGLLRRNRRRKHCLGDPLRHFVTPESSNHSDNDRLPALRELNSWTPKFVDSASSSPTSIPLGAGVLAL